MLFRLPLLRPQCAVNLDRNLKPKLAIMRQCTSVTDGRTDRWTLSPINEEFLPLSGLQLHNNADYWNNVVVVDVKWRCLDVRHYSVFHATLFKELTYRLDCSPNFHAWWLKWRGLKQGCAFLAFVGITAHLWSQLAQNSQFFWVWIDWSKKWSHPMTFRDFEKKRQWPTSWKLKSITLTFRQHDGG